MKKIVINSCFGGFSLSPLAIKRLAELQGRECYFFKTEYKDLDKYIPISLEEAENISLFFSSFDIPNPNEVLRSSKDWHSMTMEERKASNELYKKHSFGERDISRDSPLLIQIVQELGNKANGRCADLKIVEIPEDVEWVIDEYDGSETVEESHRSWS